MCLWYFRFPCICITPFFAISLGSDFFLILRRAKKNWNFTYSKKCHFAFHTDWCCGEGNWIICWPILQLKNNVEIIQTALYGNFIKFILIYIYVILLIYFTQTFSEEFKDYSRKLSLATAIDAYKRSSIVEDQISQHRIALEKIICK